MDNDSRKIVKLYENVANLGPAGQSATGLGSPEPVVISLPTGYATKDIGHNEYAAQENEEDWADKRKDMVAANLISINKSLKSIDEDFRRMKDIPPWVQEKLSVATQYMSDISDYYDGKTGD